MYFLDGQKPSKQEWQFFRFLSEKIKSSENLLVISEQVTNLGRVIFENVKGKEDIHKDVSAFLQAIGQKTITISNQNEGNISLCLLASFSISTNTQIVELEISNKVKRLLLQVENRICNSF